MSDLSKRWTEDCLKTLREEADPHEAGYYCAWIDAPELDLQRLALTVGDCLQCFRSALDHLAFELASAFTIPMTDDTEKSSEFPILSDVDRHGNFGKGPDKWRDSRASKVGGMDSAAQALIEGLQPYHRGEAYDTDPLWRLHELNRIDKHRVLHVVTRAMEGSLLDLAGAKNLASLGTADGSEWTLRSGGEIMPEGRALVARWAAVPIDPAKPMHVGFKPVLGVSFAPGTPLVADTPVLEVLGEIRDHIMSAVLPPLVGFL